MSIGGVYLAGQAVAQAAPTPGGIGTAEAALIAGLTALGLAAEIAVPAVFLYRFATFWLPILPGWVAIRHLLRIGASWAQRRRRPCTRTTLASIATGPAKVWVD